ncbi:hypothetical protein NDN08_002024 [Rhodosorus marinus]|uniref:Probable ATP-dependent transporter ycf16 n=1 Tax=Rhodosorus marinus TaxID=101924 RepID=A0AAV8UWY8_9RHOD|nr:hypothetical protein NDN08_002024 [Rhodosorus marinus]
MKLAVDGLCASTVDHRELFENVSFNCERGERVFILGPSGTGKSTLLRVVARLHDKTGGSVMLDGSSSSRFVPGSWRARVMYVPQATKNNLPAGPSELLHVVAKYRAQIRRNQVRKDLLCDFLKKVGLDEAFAEKQWRDMSGGEAQRAALCVVLSLQPDFLLLDEPTSACDPESTRKVEKTLIESGIGLVWVTHNPEQYKTVGGRAIHMEPLERSLTPAEPSQIEHKQPDQVGSHDVEKGLSRSLNRTAKTAAAAVVSASLIENSHALKAVTGSGGDTEEVSWIGLAEAGLLLIMIALLCSVFTLGIEGKLVVAGFRSFVQLLLLGAVLFPVFNINNALLSLGYICIMVLVAVQEAMSRPSYTFPRMLRCVYLSVGGSIGAFSVFGLFVVLRVGLDARYAVPLTGMMLGNCLTCISVSLSALVADLKEKSEVLEHYLSFGASKYEATKPLLNSCIRLGLTGQLNQMNVAGIVAIPGMMTGQILGGNPPLTAARYQIFVLLMNAGTSVIGSFAVMTLTVQELFDVDHKFVGEALTKRKNTFSVTSVMEGAIHWLTDVAKAVVNLLLSKWREFHPAPSPQEFQPLLSSPPPRN